ncbi:ROK family protein [Parachlamydia sp. AcF125]|uniref:ROK family protein n=1 Tax=Parachlamydia sp. AcF125 TaxID=2795736 RepID=UPI001BC8F4EC|nr:ROK family protein [Parachlamydia sp. AcF125]MBS4168389.1 Glucokinase [Parachlamydia sp. AcF125]
MRLKKWTIGIDVGGTKIEAALVDTEGSILFHSKSLTPAKEGLEAIVHQIGTTIQNLHRQAPEPVMGVGIGIPGQIHSASTVLSTPNLPFKNTPLKKLLENFTPLPIYIDNDVRTATRGEWIFGAGKNCSNFVCMFLGTGVGGGAVINHRIFSGSTHTAGEIGHMTVDLNGPLCTCGNYGCVEAYSGGWAIAKRAKVKLKEYGKPSPLLELAQQNLDNIDAALVFEAAKHADPIAMEVIRDASNALIACASTIVNILNPKRLIIGGGILSGYPHFLEEIRAGIQMRALAAALQELEVVATATQGKASLLGAAVLALESQFSDLVPQEKIKC